MHWFRRTRRPTIDDAREEVQAHLDLRADQLRAMGRSPADSIREARLQLGNPRVILERLERFPRLRALGQDVRAGLRVLPRHPEFVAAAVLPFALALTLATVTVTAVDVVLLKPLPYAEPGRTVLLAERWPDAQAVGWRDRTLHTETFRAWQQVGHTLDHIALYHTPFQTLVRPDERLRLPAASVTARFFDIVSLPPIAGRYFTTDDESGAGLERAVVLSEALWRDAFGSDPGVVGTTVPFDEGPGRVVGVAPAELAFPSRRTALWTLLPSDALDDAASLAAIGRIGAANSIADVAAEGTTLVGRLQEDGDAAGGDTVPAGVDAIDMAEAAAMPVRHGLWLVGAASLSVLAAAVLHFVHLLLVHAQRYRRDLATRSALGASGARLTILLATTVTAIGLIAAATAVLLAAGLVRAAPVFLPADFPRLDELVLSGRAVGTAVVVAAVAVLLGAGALAVRVTRQSVRTPGPMHDGGRGATTVRTRGALALLVGEVAFSVALLIVAGLLVRSFLNLAGTSPGYDARGALSAQVSFPSAMSQLERRGLVERLLDSVRTVPGVVHAGVSNTVPLESAKVVLQLGRGDDRVILDLGVVSPGYLESLGASIVQGRDLAWSDRESTLPVALINQAALDRHFPNREPIGLQIAGADNDRSFTVVGVVSDVRLEGPFHAAAPAVYVSLLQRNQATYFHRVNLVVRTDDDPMTLTAPLREVVRATDARLALADVTTLDRQLSGAVAEERLYAVALGSCAVLSLVMVVVGLFATLAYAAGQRRKDVAIRQALGATSTHVVAFVARACAGAVALGVSLGVGAGLVVGQVARVLLHDVAPHDPATVAGAAGLMALAALAAGYVPVASVVRTDIARELRAD